jgi:hypothetical protein
MSLLGILPTEIVCQGWLFQYPVRLFFIWFDRAFKALQNAIRISKNNTGHLKKFEGYCSRAMILTVVY